MFVQCCEKLWLADQLVLHQGEILKHWLNVEAGHPQAATILSIILVGHLKQCNEMMG